jgi:beta-lactam-binding protein with PASTA domain
MEEQIMNNVEEVTTVVEEIVEQMPSKGKLGLVKKGLMILGGVGAGVAVVKVCEKVVPPFKNWTVNRAKKKLEKAGYSVYSNEELDNVEELDSID